MYCLVYVNPEIVSITDISTGRNNKTDEAEKEL